MIWFSSRKGSRFESSLCGSAGETTGGEGVAAREEMAFLA